jgi:hypothetical protein
MQARRRLPILALTVVREAKLKPRRPPGQLLAARDPLDLGPNQALHNGRQIGV